jgi:hypothetical protein
MAQKIVLQTTTCPVPLPPAAQSFADRYDANFAAKYFCTARQFVPNRFDSRAPDLVSRVSL